ncbi:methyltransferase domain-containing protein [Streptacidiphilus melanogenes]|uniref:methyltransferase domain-containing protein n=1 Tax=Streptacidiphilus melanogenes TaxID=411235 RepID=UPI000B20A1EB|nr:methyltransferase domain-containing protein [Streptacidiphilus melanogenes]
MVLPAVLPVQRVVQPYPTLPPSPPVPPIGFAPGAQAWLAKLGGLRNVVRQELVSRQLDEQLGARFGADARLRVLDVGCGQATQALRLARRGHQVTGLDPDPAMLAAARQDLALESAEVQARVQLLPGSGEDCGRWFGPAAFDLVLCHGVLMYLPEPGPLLAALARILAPGGLLSVLSRNGDGLAMRPGLAGDWAGAVAAFDGDDYTNRLGLPTRADRRETLARTLAELDVPVLAWFGVRVFTDLAADDAPLPAETELAALLEAEHRAGRTDPYRQLAALIHLVGARP